MWVYEDAKVLSGEEALRYGVKEGAIVKVKCLAAASAAAAAGGGEEAAAPAANALEAFCCCAPHSCATPAC